MVHAITYVLLSKIMLFSAFVHAQSVDEIIAKNIEARGGYEKLKSVSTLKTTGTALQMGMEFPITVFKKRPNLMRMEATIQGMSLVRILDGETAWMINPFEGNPTPQELPEEQRQLMEENTNLDGHLVDYKEKGHTAELLGKEDIEGTEVYKIKLTLKSGRTMYYFLDSEYYIELKTVGKGILGGQEIETENYYGDYKDVDGMMIPHAIETKNGGQTILQMNIEKVETNIEIDSSIFTALKEIGEQGK